MYLKAWSSLCIPKEAGGLGFRQMKDINEAFVTKLVWQLNTDTRKLWVQVFRAKYLRGLNFMDDIQPSRNTSWIWSSIMHCKENFHRGACYTVRSHSRLRVSADPWIPGIARHRLIHDIHWPVDVYYVKDLMISGGEQWDMDLIRRLVPQDVAMKIQSTRILPSSEQEALFWVPSKTGIFSIKSAYRTKHGERFVHNSPISRLFWKNLWNSDLHTRHKMILWRLVSN